VLALRVTRDKRGYEHIYLIDEQRRRGRSEGRLLYWCRLPGAVRVGREPLDEQTRAELERANPDVTFDWPALLKTLASSLAQARWAARQQRLAGPGSRPPRRGPQGGDRGDADGDWSEPDGADERA
jgi:hypothetical protein